jgi:hypothetical protein
VVEINRGFIYEYSKNNDGTNISDNSFLLSLSLSLSLYIYIYIYIYIYLLNPLAKKLYSKHLLMWRWLIGKYYLTVIERYTIRQIHGDYSTPNLQTSIKLELSRRKDSLVSTSSFFKLFSWQLYGNLWLIFWLLLQLVFSVRLTNDWTLRPFSEFFFFFSSLTQ